MSRTPLALGLLRLVWILQVPMVGPLFVAGTSTLPDGGQLIASIAAWLVWASVLLATFVPSSVSLTVGRVVSPIALAVSLELALAGDVEAWKVVVGIAGSALALLVWFSGDIGAAFAQGSAYGNEERFPLRPPVPYLPPMVVSWMVLAATTIAGVTLLVNERWIAGVVGVVVSAAIGWFVGPRFHQFARRWFVVVPVGVVVHDPVLLGENALFRSNVLTALHLAPADTQAADLTGGTAGVVVEVVVSEMQTVIKRGGRSNPRGDAIHVLSVLVSPTRPGRALAAAAARKLPVG